MTSFLQLDHQTKFHGFQLIGKTLITVIYKTGGVTNPEKTTGRSVVFHTFQYSSLTTMLYNRLLAVLDRYQCAGQAGFRNNSKQPDHLMTYKLISQRSREWETDMRVAATDIKKALDSVQHEAIWRSLRNQSISEHLKNCTLINAPPY